jgi:hypothetical protein
VCAGIGRSFSVTFTAQQLADWRAYERVRQSGRHNMFFPQAQRATGLSSERYSFVMANYSALMDAQPKKASAK